jgi:hypothetical protein
MAVQKNNYSPVTNIQPFLMFVRKSADSDFIILGDEPPSRNAQITTTIDREIVWLKVETDYRVTVLASTPNNITPVAPDFNNWSQSKVMIKAGEVFVAEYPDATMNDAARLSLTGFQMGTLDSIYILINRRLNTITICQTQPTA